MITELEDRDERDSKREIDPLQLADPEKAGYWVIDNSNEKPEETINRIVVELKRRGLVKDD
jgi:cytidylate kinase